MAKITRDRGPTDDLGPEPQTPADILRERGKLGPYGGDVPRVTDPAAEPAEQAPDDEPEATGEATEDSNGPAPDDPEGDNAQGEGAGQDPLDRPSGRASKAEWLAYAQETDPERVLTEGADPEGYTRDELRSLYA